MFVTAGMRVYTVSLHHLARRFVPGCCRNQSVVTYRSVLCLRVVTKVVLQQLLPVTVSVFPFKKYVDLLNISGLAAACLLQLLYCVLIPFMLFTSFMPVFSGLFFLIWPPKKEIFIMFSQPGKHQSKSQTSKLQHLKL